jgi:hypothetical protein
MNNYSVIEGMNVSNVSFSEELTGELMFELISVVTIISLIATVCFYMDVKAKHTEHIIIGCLGLTLCVLVAAMSFSVMSLAYKHEHIPWWAIDTETRVMLHVAGRGPEKLQFGWIDVFYFFADVLLSGSDDS